jgi:hypothetical protein
MSADTLVEEGSMIASSIGAHFLLKHLNPKLSKIKHGIGILGIAFASGIIATVLFHHYIERRADTEGLYATQCSICAHESAARRHASFAEEKNPLRYNGYLWANDMEKIANELKAENKICAYHEGQKTDNVIDNQG